MILDLLRVLKKSTPIYDKINTLYRQILDEIV